MIKKFSNMNQLKAGVAMSYTAMILGNLISIVYTPMMLRLLGQNEYGLYNLVASVVSYLGLLSFGFGSAYMKYYSKYKVKEEYENIAKLNSMFLICFTIIGVISLLAGSVLVNQSNNIFGSKLTVSELKTAKIVMAIMVVNLALSFPASLFHSYVTANEKYVFQKSLLIIKTVVNPFIMLPVLLLGYKSIGMVVVTTMLTISVELCNTIFCFKKLKIKFHFQGFDFKLLKEIFTFSSYIFLNIIIDQVNWNVDKFILGRFRGTASVAIYGIATQINTYYMSLSAAVANVFIPKINRMVAKDKNAAELTNIMIKIGRIQFIVLSLICSGLIFFGRPFIIMWAGANYAEAYPILLLLVIPVTIPLIQNIGLEIQKAKNMHKFRSVVYFGIAIVNIAISIPLCKLYGGIGCAIGTAFALILGNILIMNWYYGKRIGLLIKDFWVQIFKFLPALILPSVFGILIGKFVNLYSSLHFVVFGMAYTIVFCVSFWLIGMNQYEKDLIQKPLLKYIRR